MNCPHCNYDNDRRAKTCGLCNKFLVREGQGKVLSFSVLIVSLLLIIAVVVVFFLASPMEEEENTPPPRRRPEPRWGIGMVHTEEYFN